MKSKIAMMAVAAFALVTGAQANQREFDSFQAFQAAKPLPQYLANWKQVAAQGGPGFEQTKEAVGTFIKRCLKDPDSAKDISCAMPYFNTRATVHKDWIIKFACNAKNSFGAYVGTKVYVVLWRGGGIDWDGINDPARAFLRGMYEGLNEEPPIAN